MSLSSGNVLQKRYISENGKNYVFFFFFIVFIVLYN